MDDSQARQVGRIVASNLNISNLSLTRALEKVQDEFGRAGRHGSGLHVVGSVSATRDVTLGLLAFLRDQIAGVSRTPPAFEELSSAMRRWLRSCEDRIAKHLADNPSVRLQGRGTSKTILHDEMRKLADEITERVEVERYEFERSTISTANGPKRRGGRPPAEFWDDMWASIATSLFAGQLQPKTQADVVRAMTEWIEGKGHSAVESTIKSRARRLWDRIEALDD